MTSERRSSGCGRSFGRRCRAPRSASATDCPSFESKAGCWCGSARPSIIARSTRAAPMATPLTPRRAAAASIRTMTDRFLYPGCGPGMMWDAFANPVVALDGTVRLGRHVTHCELASTGMWTVSHRGSRGDDGTCPVHARDLDDAPADARGGHLARARRSRSRTRPAAEVPGLHGGRRHRPRSWPEERSLVVRARCRPACRTRAEF